MVTGKVSDLVSENVTLQKKCEKSSKTFAETKAGLTTDFGETRDDFGMIRKNCNALRVKVGELENGLAALRDSPTANGKR